MKISCIIPTHNRNEFLVEAVNSVLSQTFQPFEIIIVNNGSNAIDLSEDIKNKVAVFNIVPNAGASQARNFGATMAQGEYLAFLDDDDLWSSDYLMNVSKVLDKNKCVVSRLDKMLDGKISHFKNAHDKLTINNLFIYNPGVTGSNVVISKDLFFKVGGYDIKLVTSEDKSLIAEIIMSGEKIVVLPDNQAIRRMHGGEQLSELGSAAMSEGILQFARKYRKLMGRKIYFFNLSKAYKNRVEAGEKLLLLKYFIAKTIYLFFKIFK